MINAKSYVNIQLALYNNSFDVSYQVDDSVQSAKVICILLQPLIENALEHGIDRKCGGRGLLDVSIVQVAIVCLSGFPTMGRDSMCRSRYC